MIPRLSSTERRPARPGQAFVELAFDFITGQAKSIFHHDDLNKFVAPVALTVFVWVLLMNALDFLPVDIVALGTHHVNEHGFRIVPTADVNTTFALALTVWLLMIYFNIAVKGVGGWLHELTCSPFGYKPFWAAPFLIFFNVLFNFIEYESKPLSHSLRLFGNMYAGEIIFLLLWLWAATGLGVLHPYYREVGTAYLARLGLAPWIMWATCAGEVALAAVVAAARPRTWLVGATN